MITTARGIAKNTEQNREYLSNCPTVRNITEAAGDMLTFNYDQSPNDVPDGVFFDLTEAPF